MRKRTSPKESLSKFEWLIMNLVWDQKEISAREVVDALSETYQRAYTTIQTYLERLLEKGYVTKRKIGLVNFYAAEVHRDQIVQGETDQFVDRVFKGSPSNLAAYLLKQKKLSSKELEQLRQLLEEDQEHD